MSFYNVDDIMQIFGVGRSKAYQMIRMWNLQLGSENYYTTRGKISKRFVDEKIYGKGKEDEH